MKQTHFKPMASLALALVLALGTLQPLGVSFGATTNASTTTKSIELTLEALKAYNGTKSKPMYVAYKDVIYDVSKVEAFKKNTYKTLVPGTDITKALAKIKNGESLLKSAVKVGKVVAKASTTTTAAKPTTASTATSTTKPATKPSTDATSSATKQLELTLEQLKAYDGKGEHPAYVAVDGIIYDVTAIPEWKNGIHQGKYKAGLDLSEAIKSSPHGKEILDRAIVVGKVKVQ